MNSGQDLEISLADPATLNEVTDEILKNKTPPIVGMLHELVLNMI